MADYLPRPEGITEYEWKYFLNTDPRTHSYIADKVKAAMDTPEYKAVAIEASTEHFEKWLAQHKPKHE